LVAALVSRDGLCAMAASSLFFEPEISKQRSIKDY